MELEYHSPGIEQCLNPFYKTKKDENLNDIFEGTKRAFLNTNKKVFNFDLIESQEQLKNISSDTIWKIVEKMLTNENVMTNIFLLAIEIQSKTNITKEARNILINNKELILPLINILNNIQEVKEFNFVIRNIDSSGDPEIPEWKPIIINLEIKSKNFDERLKIKHELIKKAYAGLNNDSRKNIYIIGAI